MSADDAGIRTPNIAAEPDLVGLFREKAVATSHRTLVVLAATSAVGVFSTALFSNGRYYLTLPFVATACFAVYGIAAHRAQRAGDDADDAFARQADAKILMKGAELLGFASAVAALLTFFFLVLGPSWYS
jgi:hypothetical protein